MNEMLLLVLVVAGIAVVVTTVVYASRDSHINTLVLDLNFKFKQIEDELKQQGRLVAKIPDALKQVDTMNAAVTKLDVDVENCQDHLARVREQQLSIREMLLTKRNKVMVEFSEQAKEIAQKIKREKL